MEELSPSFLGFKIQGAYPNVLCPQIYTSKSHAVTLYGTLSPRLLT